jgi:hypothetical protein
MVVALATVVGAAGAVVVVVAGAVVVVTAMVVVVAGQGCTVCRNSGEAPL